MIETLKKSLLFLDHKLKKRIVFIFFIIVFSMLVETFSVALIVPAVNLILDSDFFLNYPKISNFLYLISPIHFFKNETTSFSESTYVITSGMMLFMLTYLIKGIFLFLFEVIKANFRISIDQKLSRDFLSGYMDLPYSIYLNRNSADMIKKTTDLVSNLTDTIINYIILLTEVLVLIGILILTVFYKPIITITILTVLFLFGYTYYLMTSRRFQSFGRIRSIYDIKRLKILSQTFAGIKEIKIYNIAPSLIIKNYLGASNKVFFAAKWSSIFSGLPRNLLEILAVFILSILVLYMSVKLDLQIEVISTLALFAGVAFRLIPTATRILYSLGRIKFGMPIVNSLYEEQKIFNSNKKKELLSETKLSNSIIIKNCSFSYQDSNFKVLENINLEIKKNDFIGIVGESGSGKTTFLNIMLGLYKFTDGEIYIDNEKILGKIKWSNKVGYVPQNIFIVDDNIKNNITLNENIDGINFDNLKKAINQAQLEKTINNLPNGINTIIGERGSRLSVGQIQRVGIARALYLNPEILFFDEVTSSLDKETEEDLVGVINQFKGKKTIFMISHRPNVLKACNKIFKIDEKKFKKIEL